VADNGSILLGVQMHPDPGAGGLFSQWYGSLSWWQNIRNIGHFNVVRADSRPDVVSLSNIESAYDTMVSLAGQTGAYVIIGNAYGAGSKTNCPSLSQLLSFWSQIAPRYANNTNVIYEIFNEADFCFGGSDWVNMENSVYNTVRSGPPNTPIIVASFTGSSYGEMAGRIDPPTVLPQLTSVNWSNAVVGWHGYNNNCPDLNTMNDGDNQMRRAGYPTFMNEADNEVCGGNGGFSAGFPLIANYMEPKDESWVWLDADGFLSCTDGITYGNPSRNPQCLNITWPLD